MCLKMRLASRFCPLVFLSFLSFASVAAAQHKDSDFGVWGSVTLKKQFVGGFSGSLNCEIRSDSNVSNIALWWINPELKYKFNDYFTAEIGYRYSNVDRSDYYEQAHRWYTGGTAGMDWGPFRLTWRELIEQIYYTDRPEGSSGRVVSYLRTRLGIKLNVENMPIDPYFDVENFFHISDYRAGEVGIMRYTAGLRIPFGGGMHTLNIYYRYQQYFTSSPDDHILGLGYVLSL
ncbi:MAG: DUF2490 domain-containing protein [Muribaculum sp.]|uniref:DUF2490 domain-containing protein n=1 Tax=Candidatus Merdivivens faecigallinarum TaxID=2840871 RepID=A0A9D9J1S4_9BACT|nr:DUF2490 domain-containing protein [Candidatus Merdivivens faecigallinarum]